MRTYLRDLEPVSTLSFLEVGAGTGYNVPYWRQFGFVDITINDIRPEALADASQWGVRLLVGNAALLTIPPVDVVYAGTVFSSILGNTDRHDVAGGLWRLAKRAILIYDFTWNNPANPDVRKVTTAEIRSLFPLASIESRRLTLAPPIARRIPAWIYPLVNWPLLQTHRLWLVRRPI
jgi:SAM-dependent methyltransferase